jgi:hypothetical protein
MSESGPQPPYGQQQPPASPPPQHNPYGQPPAQHQPPQQPPGPAQPFGQPAYGAPVPAYGAPQPGPDKRPATVTAAGVITIALSALALVGCVFVVFSISIARADIVAEIERQVAADPTLEQQLQGFDASVLVPVMIGVVIGFAVWALVAIVLAVLAMRRSSVARIALVVSSVLTGLLAILPTFTAVVPVVWVLGSVAVVVCLFAGGASRWYAGTGAPVGRGGMAPPVA